VTHEHSSEYQVRIVHEDETEELSGWMSRQEEIAQAITGLRGSPSKAYWLQIRDILCLNCLDRELTMVEFSADSDRRREYSFPRQTDRKPFGSGSSRTSSVGA
jgi:hypothetical protein